MLIVYYTVVTLNYKIISVSCFGVLFSGTIRGLLYAKGFKELIWLKDYVSLCKVDIDVIFWSLVMVAMIILVL